MSAAFEVHVSDDEVIVVLRDEHRPAVARPVMHRVSGQRTRKPCHHLGGGVVASRSHGHGPPHDSGECGCISVQIGPDRHHN